MDDSPSKTDSDVFPDISCRLILIGKTGCGKSSTGNTILGKDVFQANTGINSETKLGNYGTAERGNLTIEVMDTPGLSDTDGQDFELEAEIKKSLFSMQPGPHALLLVVKCCDRFTQEDLRVYNALKKIFGEHLPFYTIVVFTGVETIEGGKKNFKQQQLPQSKMLSFIVNEASRRYIFLHNKSRNPAKKEKDVTRLIKKVKKLVMHNSTPYFQHTFSQDLDPCLQLMTEAEMILFKVQAFRPDKSRDTLESADDSVARNTDPSELAHASDHLRESIVDRNNTSSTDLDNQIMGPDGPSFLSGDLNQAHAVKTRTYSDEETLSATPPDSSAAIHLLSPLKFSPGQKFKPMRRPDFCRNTLISTDKARQTQTANNSTANDDIKGHEDTTLSTTVDNQTVCGVHTNQDKKIIDEDQATDNGQTSSDKTQDNEMTANNSKIGNAKSLDIYSDFDQRRLLTIRVKDKIVNRPDDLTEVQREEYLKSLSDLEDRIVDGLIEAEVKNKNQCSLM